MLVKSYTILRFHLGIASGIPIGSLAAQLFGEPKEEMAMSALDQLLASAVAGRVGRREFITRATALGIGAGAVGQMLSALEAHAESTAAGTNTLTLNAVQVFGNI